MIHMMGLAEADFEKVKAGTKTLELRLFSKRKASIEIGDSICFESQGNGSQKIICEVRSIHRGETFHDLFSTQLNPQHAGFESTAKTIEAVRRFYNEEDEKVAGVICFGIALTEVE